MILDDSTGIAAVVTGGASGLGEATVRALAGRGVRVGILDRDRERGQALADAIGGAFAKVDVARDDDVARAFEEVRRLNGQERILVCCAGTGDAFKTAWRDRETGDVRAYPIDRFRRIVEINLVGTFRCIAAAAAGMMALAPDAGGERGVIVTTSSVTAEDGQIGQAAYAGSKAAIAGMTLPIARDLMGEGIRVNAIMPGIFDTPLFASAPQKVRDSLAAAVPFPKRVGDPAEFARLVLAMVEIGYFNGENVRLDGAIRMAPR